jgi:hypothetical protein
MSLRAMKHVSTAHVRLFALFSFLMLSSWARSGSAYVGYPSSIVVLAHSGTSADTVCPATVVTARVVTRLRRRRERRVRERADRDDNEVRLGWLGVEDLRAAVGAEVEDVLLSVCLVRDSRVVVEATDNLYLIRFESGLHPEGASGPTLAGKAVTDGHRERVARDFQAKLTTVTGGISGGHRCET